MRDHLSISVDTVRMVPLFQNMSDDMVRRILPHIKWQICQKGEHLITSGDSPDFIGFILSGKVQVVVYEEDKKAIIATLGAGDMIGEMGAIDGYPRSADVIACSECNYLRLNDQALKQEIIPNNPEVAYGLLRVVIKRLRQADNRIESLALMDVRGRVARHLMDIATVDEEGRYIIRNRLNRSAIAEYVGASREMVSRVMRDLELQQFVILHKDFVELQRI